MGEASTDFENFGVIDAIDYSAPNPNTPGLINNYYPGTVTTAITSGTFNNHAGGIIEIGQSAGIALLTIAASTVFTNDGTLLAQDATPTSTAGGTIDIAAYIAGSGTIALSGGGTVELGGATGNSQTIDFAGTGTLILDQPAFVPAIIAGFSLGDMIDLGVAATALSYSSGDLRPAGQ